MVLFRAIAPLSYPPNHLGVRSLCQIHLQVHLYEHLYLFIENLASTVSAT
jgi:hypothetical protein